MKTLRRNSLDLFTTTEKAIFDAHQEVERMPPDVRLTEAGNLLMQARDLVADYIDEKLKDVTLK